MRNALLLAVLAFAPISAWAQLNVNYELNEEGVASAQKLALLSTRTTALHAGLGETLTAVNLPKPLTGCRCKNVTGMPLK